jgi:hypothetical protein
MTKKDPACAELGQDESGLAMNQNFNKNISLVVAGKKKSYPRECIFSKMDIASMAIHATISVDILILMNFFNNTIEMMK